jgi:nucleotide-binding universal stress UspA family protein
MYKRIMFPVDGSELSLKAINECFGFAKALGAAVTLIYVQPHYSMHVPAGLISGVVKSLEKEREEEFMGTAQKMLAELETLGKADGVQCDGVVVVGDSPYEKIIEYAGNRNCDLIMMASHGRKGLDAVLLGSETVKVLTHTKIPVLVVR